MRVLHVLAELRHSGAERMLACSAAGWKDAGIEPILVGMGDDHPFASGLRKVGYQVIIVPKVRSLTGLAALWRTMRATRPQIVHIHSESCFDLVSVIAAFTPGVEGIVRTVHSNFRFSGFVRGRRILRAALTRRLGVVWVACSHEVAEAERSCSSNRVRVVENWVDVEAIMHRATPEARRLVRQELGIEADAPALALIGNCGGAKNHELVAVALPAVEMPVHVLHIGHARYQPEAEARAWQSVPDRHVVHHLGERNDVPELLAASDLLLMPSLYEGLGLAAVEALCAHVPVLSANTVGLQWLAGLRGASLVDLTHEAWAIAVSDALTRDHDSAARDAAAIAARARFRPERGVREYVASYEVSRGEMFSLFAGRLRAARAAGGQQ